MLAARLRVTLLSWRALSWSSQTKCIDQFFADVLCHRRCSGSVHRLVSQGRYRDAVAVWEAAKAAGTVSAPLYTPLMRLADAIGSATIAQELRRDMLSQHWVMDSKCAFHYACALIAEEFVEEAVSFLSAGHCEEPACLSAVAERLEAAGHRAAALRVCGLSPLLHGYQLELLGSAGDTDAMAMLITEHYSGGVLPQRVQLGLASGLAVSGHIHKAVDIAASAKYELPARLLALLVKAVSREPTAELAAGVIELLPASFAHSSLCVRVVNAAIQLQAVAHRESFTTAPVVDTFVGRDLFQELQAAALHPDPHTCQALLLLYCFDASVKGAVYKAFSVCRDQVVPGSLSSWVRWCGVLQPCQASRVLGAVLTLCQTLDLRPDIELLLSLGVASEDMLVTQWVKSMVVSMPRLLQDSAPALLSAVADLSQPSALYSVYGELLEAGWQPSLAAFQQLVDRASESQVMSSEATYGVWRLLVRERIQPDQQLLNKLLKCCQQTRDVQRALFFLSVFSEHQLQPSVDTYQTLLQVCSEDAERAAAVQQLASKSFPVHFHHSS